MESAGMLSVILMILNIVHVIFGLLLTAVSIWFFVEVHDLTSMRNSNHYLLDYNVYWPQAIPWVFMIIGLLVLFISLCGCMGAKRKTRGLLQMYVTFETLVILAVIIAVVVSLVFADSTSTDKFIKDTVWDAYTNMKTEEDVQKSFGTIEKRFQCCGADGPRDYINWRRDGFPESCCDTYYHGWIGSYNIDCDFTNKLANERHGCSEVAANYTRVIIKALSAVSIITAVIGIANILVAIFLFKSLSGRDSAAKNVTVYHDVETKKVLLN